MSEHMSTRTFGLRSFLGPNFFLGMATRFIKFAIWFAKRLMVMRSCWSRNWTLFGSTEVTTKPMLTSLALLILEISSLHLIVQTSRMMCCSWPLVGIQWRSRLLLERKKKLVQFNCIYILLCDGRPMTNYSGMKDLVEFVHVLNCPVSTRHRHQDGVLMCISTK
jgi:hypothetical protein